MSQQVKDIQIAALKSIFDNYNMHRMNIDQLAKLYEDVEEMVMSRLGEIPFVEGDEEYDEDYDKF